MPSAEIPDLKGLEDLVSDELNVKEIEVVSGLADLVSYSVKPNFKALGPRFGPRVKDVAAALAGADARTIVEAVETTGAATITVGAETIALQSDELDIRVEGRTGYSLVQEAAYGVALDLEVTEELRAEGIAREVVRAIQDLRKAKGFAVEDRIELRLGSSIDAIASALRIHHGFIADEVLATTVTLEAPEGASDDIVLDEGRVSVGIAKAKV
jgi:isoleucyl-tRNA synthetase